MSHTWMRHREHGGTARIADTALDTFAGLGWEPCDPPRPDDPTLRDHVPAVPPPPPLLPEPETETETETDEDVT